MSKYPNYTEEEDQFLRNHFSKHDNRWISIRLGRSYSSVKSRVRKLGLIRTEEERKALYKNLPVNSGGFKKGAKPHNTLPLGKIVLPPSIGYWLIKTRKGMEFYHRWLWRQEHGEIPEGMNIAIMLDREHWEADWRAIKLEHLEQVSNAELARRNVDYEKSSKSMLSKVWSDEYIAKQITKHHDLDWQEVMGTPLIPIKRAEILIKRKIKDNDTSRQTE